MGCQPQQGLSIIRPDVLPQGFDHRFVTAHFHVLPGKAKGQPHQRVEPVQAQSRVAQQLPDWIAPADMVLLVGKDEIPFFPGCTGRKIHPRANHTHNEGGRNAVRQIDIFFHRHRFCQSAPQSKILGNAVYRHDGRPGQPDVRSGLHGGQFCLRLLQLLRRLGWNKLLPDRRGNALPDRLSSRLIGYGTDTGGGIHWNRLQHGQTGGDGQGAQKPEQHNRPQGIGIDLRRPFQEKPRQQHHGNHNAAGKAHIENFGKCSLHTLTPAWNR